ncbi:MAG: xylulokinase, partial [bacterium]
GKRVVRVNHDEGPAYGAALLAGVGAGVYPDVAAAADATVKTASVVKPQPDLAPVYAKAHERYRELYRALRDSFRAFAAE